MYLILFNLGMMQKNMQASQKRFQRRLKKNRNPPQQRKIPSSVTTANNSDNQSKTLWMYHKVHSQVRVLIICLMQNCPIQKL